jgi:hypothetical protein
MFIEGEKMGARDGMVKIEESELGIAFLFHFGKDRRMEDLLSRRCKKNYSKHSSTREQRHRQHL